MSFLWCMRARRTTTAYLRALVSVQREVEDVCDQVCGVVEGVVLGELLQIRYTIMVLG